MRDLRTRALCAAAAALLVLGSVTGCSGTAEPAAPTAGTTASSAGGTTGNAATAGTGRTTAAHPVTAKKPAACHDADLAITITAQPDDPGTGATLRAMVTLTNKSRHTCTLNGWPSVAPYDMAGEVIKVATVRKVAQPGPVAPFTVDPGVSAFAGLKWATCGDDENCGWGNALRASVQGPATQGQWAELEGFGDAEHNNIRIKSLQIGTLQPSHQGVVAW
ncbi:hypothetical protein ACWT_0927 [Actinoplanes sp. SE50]|uniref:DUF4232 domain-containing protein n=1 Tax=unclassified Actinoplanes TaxID=2626549 RepID=UPI00023EC583|nr:MULTISPECIES: DUF4232 domain-containing protein [unclassified Actinoplanes]AEV81942.1 hypothetical protein ACPL_1045 [Actinoplanes sp. SE50/110]ATO80342.1 hypothetical protein ACWT_0927 [Actinoplanes sp. SE50]SLL97748.1 hypothetical protein ACSP50_0957 [Actinoplanes sp. SE50/110]